MEAPERRPSCIDKADKEMKRKAKLKPPIIALYTMAALMEGIP
jgi:hypothetical protein